MDCHRIRNQIFINNSGRTKQYLSGIAWSCDLPFVRPELFIGGIDVMDIRYGICLAEAEYIIADYLKTKGYELYANFSDEDGCNYVQYDEDTEQIIAFAQIDSAVESGEKE